MVALKEITLGTTIRRDKSYNGHGTDAIMCHARHTGGARSGAAISHLEDLETRQVTTVGHARSFKSREEQEKSQQQLQ